MKDALIKAGMPPAAIEVELAKLPTRPDAMIELDADDDGLSVGLFEALSTQWRVAGMGGVRMGIDYTAIPATASAFGIPLDPQRMVDLRDMEAEALKTFAEQRT